MRPESGKKMAGTLRAVGAGPFVALSLALWSGRTDAAPPGAATYEFTQEHVELDTESVELQTHQLHLARAITPDVRLSVSGGFIAADAGGNRSVSHLADSKIAMSWRPDTNLLIRLAANLPTGITELDSDEFDLAIWLQDELLQFAVPSLGSGTMLSGGASYTYSPAPRWSVGVGSAVGYHSDIRPLDAGESVERGMRVSMTGAVDYSAARWGWRSLLAWARRGDGAIGESVVDVDPSWGVETALVGRGRKSNLFVRFGYSVPSRYSVSSEDGLLYSTTRGARTRVGLGGGWRIAPKVDLEASVEMARHAGWTDEGVDGIGAATRLELRVGSSIRLAPQTSLMARVGTLSGQVDGNDAIDEAGRADLGGYRLRLALEQRF
ncbi:MAG: hypothetical protein KDA27_26335 [Candidatus Eisenbacteria bacterium]|uniref:Porin n=1 Tax=Eiseniibacteriota bacterium TaxID=2212470 RepID=A0A956NI22_UNCEI|nr:hypothetical protein [Candidatus Eisenbacteria bacterium]